MQSNKMGNNGYQGKNKHQTKTTQVDKPKRVVLYKMSQNVWRGDIASQGKPERLLKRQTVA